MTDDTEPTTQQWTDDDVRQALDHGTAEMLAKSMCYMMMGANLDGPDGIMLLATAAAHWLRINEATPGIVEDMALSLHEAVPDLVASMIQTN